MISDALSTVTATATSAAGAVSDCFTDWPALIAAVFAGLSGMVTLVFGLRAKARQAEAATELALIRARMEAAAEHAADASQQALRTAQSVQESREERHCQIDGVRADLGRLRAEFQGGQQDGNQGEG
ncbi:MAG: hypothetical protein JWM59_235 [Verrucomicrobiales bacterium]|nr:hypothetical protein [Verrucomicrobiales bacterium]